jgi:hypothetical protein
MGIGPSQTTTTFSASPYGPGENPSLASLIPGMVMGAMALPKTGPYEQTQIDGFLGKQYKIPQKNPVDGSYMPECKKGPCVMMHPDGQSCMKYAEPTEIPWPSVFDTQARHSCGYDLNPVAIFDSTKPTYYVYSNQGQTPQTAGSKRKTFRRQNKRKTQKTQKTSKTHKN